MKKIHLLPVLITLSIVSCTIHAYDTKRLATDFKTKGFIDTDHFQIIVKAHPDNDKRGLISQRESAMENARQRLKQTVLEKLTDYYLSYYARKQGIANKSTLLSQTDKMLQLHQAMVQYLEYGYTAFKYYARDNSAVLVHRIVKRGLKDDIESTGISFAQHEEQHKKE
jgi:hypothetical protein